MLVLVVVFNDLSCKDSPQEIMSTCKDMCRNPC